MQNAPRTSTKMALKAAGVKVLPSKLIPLLQYLSLILMSGNFGSTRPRTKQILLTDTGFSKAKRSRLSSLPKSLLLTPSPFGEM